MPSEEEIRQGYKTIIGWAKEMLEQKNLSDRVETTSDGTFAALTRSEGSYVFAMIFTRKEEEAHYVAALLQSTYSKYLKNPQSRYKFRPAKD